MTSLDLGKLIKYFVLFLFFYKLKIVLNLYNYYKVKESGNAHSALSDSLG